MIGRVVLSALLFVPMWMANAAATPERSADTRPNIILILADDLGVEAINSYGGEYHTPRIDQLAREGMRFENAHATPLCSPTRTRLMTGLENHRNYEAFGHLAPGQRTFGNMLKEAGYVTGIVGKWQLSGNGYDGRVGITPAQAGFDESHLWQLKSLDPKGSRYWGPTRVINGKTKIIEENFGPDYDSEFALDFVERHKDQPFFLYYPMVLVHNPFVATPTSMDVQGSKQRFAGMMSYMDLLVGRLLDKLKAAGLDDNTVVIFTGDNGTNRQITSVRNGFAVRGGKGQPTVSGTHVPLIVRAPGLVPAGKVADGLVDFTDFFPTFAELAKVSLQPGAVDGVSQMPVLLGKKTSVRDSIFMHYAPVWQFPPSRFVFDARWKLYGDGRFVEMDSMAGVETEITPDKLKGEAAKRHAQFTRILRDTKDGPLNPDRYPMCVGRESRDPKLPAIQAGCDTFGAGEE